MTELQSKSTEDLELLSQIPELTCPSCRVDLCERPGALECHSCGSEYEIHDAIPHMLAGDMQHFAAEVAVQDRVALEYETKRYRDDFSKRYHDRWTDKMLKLVAGSAKKGRILDNGCGVGLLSKKLQSNRVVGMDISSEMLKKASRYTSQLVLGNSQQLPFDDASFDLVFCRSLLHHLPNPALAVSELWRVLRPGGQFVLADTNRSVLSSIPRRIAYSGEHFSEDHTNLDRRILTNLLSPYFAIDSVQYFGYIAYPLLGFPDMVNVFRLLPAKHLLERVLTSCDDFLSHIPLVRTQSWGIIMSGTRLAGKIGS